MIDTQLQAVDDYLLSIATSEVPLLKETSQHILGAGGKRLRPRLLLLAYAAAGGQEPEVAIPLAAAVEIIHTATLVHDDINDRGTLRRGHDTVNARWGTTYALLTGDFLFTKTYQIMVPYSRELNAILARAAVEVVEGETIQIKAAKQGSLDRALYFEIIAKKTAALFVAAAEMGATVANAPDEWIEALRGYAFNLGLAFQIVDDVLDLIADPHQLGKNAGIDIAQGRGIAVALGDSYGGLTTSAVKEQVWVEPALDYAIEQGREKAEELAGRALIALEALPPSSAVEELRDLVYKVIHRDH